MDGDGPSIAPACACARACLCACVPVFFGLVVRPVVKGACEWPGWASGCASGRAGPCTCLCTCGKTGGLAYALKTARFWSSMVLMQRHRLRIKGAGGWAVDMRACGCLGQRKRAGPHAGFFSSVLPPHQHTSALRLVDCDRAAPSSGSGVRLTKHARTCQQRCCPHSAILQLQLAG